MRIIDRIPLQVVMALAMTWSMASCSSDNDDPVPVVKESKSLIKTFRETYGFSARETWGTRMSDDLVIPVEGVVRKVALDINSFNYNTLWYDQYYLTEGVVYSPEHNPLWYEHWVNEYGDTTYNRAPMDSLENYAPHPYGVESITLRVPELYNVGEDWDPGCSVMYSRPYNANYKVGDDCTSLFRIRFRSIYPYLVNGYSWEGTGRTSPWVEMELTDFNAMGGTKLMDMKEFYLIAKEAPSARRDDEKKVRRYFHMDVRFEKGRHNHTDKGLTVFSCF